MAQRLTRAPSCPRFAQTALSGDGSLVAGCFDDSTVRLWDITRPRTFGLADKGAKADDRRAAMFPHRRPGADPSRRPGGVPWSWLVSMDEEPDAPPFVKYIGHSGPVYRASFRCRPTAAAPRHASHAAALAALTMRSC